MVVLVVENEEEGRTSSSFFDAERSVRRVEWIEDISYRFERYISGYKDVSYVKMPNFLYPVQAHQSLPIVTIGTGIGIHTVGDSAPVEEACLAISFKEVCASQQIPCICIYVIEMEVIGA